MKKYILMHKNIEVLEMYLAEDGVVESVGGIKNPMHLPIGLVDTSLIAVRRWWAGRTIPASRDGLKDVLFYLSEETVESMLEKSYGLSLSDHYWIKPEESSLKWEYVNFFENPFSEDMGKLLFGDKLDKRNLTLMSPDASSDGWLRKKWVIVDGDRVLLKGGSGFWQQEPYNEVIASSLMEKLAVHHVRYDLCREDDKVFSMCKDFVTCETEFIPAYKVALTMPIEAHADLYAHLMRCCDNLSIPDIRQDLDIMLTVDYIIMNEDRHLNNFGFLRNPDTLKWIGFAPIFDSGTSLWYKTRVGEKVSSKPFYASPEKQLVLVTNLNWFEPSSLDDFEEDICSIMSSSREIEEERIHSIATHVRSRIDLVERKM
jgi:hypothetical protein